MRLMVLLQNIGILGKSTGENKVYGSEQHRGGHEAAWSLKPTSGKKWFSRTPECQTWKYLLAPGNIYIPLNGTDLSGYISDLLHLSIHDLHVKFTSSACSQGSRTGERNRS